MSDWLIFHPGTIFQTNVGKRAPYRARCVSTAPVKVPFTVEPLSQELFLFEESEDSLGGVKTREILTYGSHDPLNEFGGWS
ncbi:hypothetical protein SeMB42_g03215 [Synchytrium endobioticum]|uniref:Uncharacterized protein n=1 Tax=Synchytrium endobioticum TaxID=286115 RepID=A0A507D8X7_9FUNG|nr:hypothetical protein SeMB42_g03215 [Synchytrium endobioticum]